MPKVLGPLTDVFFGSREAYSDSVMKRNTSVVWSWLLTASIVGLVVVLILTAFRIWGNK